MSERLRNSGIDIVGDVPWGTHFCQFYQTKEDLMDILVPYFKAGLENNEFCMWVTSQPLGVEEAKEAMRRAIPDIDVYLEKGQIEIISYSNWYVNKGIFNSQRVLNGWIEKLNQALANGYDGLRLTGNTFWLEKKDWDDFVNYDKEIDRIIGSYRMTALCAYSLDKCSATEIIDIAINHQSSLVKKEGKWKKIESSGRKNIEEAAIQVTKDWEKPFDAVPDLIAVTDTEYQVARAKRAMAARLGVTTEESVGETCCRVVHGTDELPSFCPHRQLLKDGREDTKEAHEDNLGGDFIVSISPRHDSEGKLIGCIHVVRDITERKRLEEQTRWRAEEVETIMEVAPVAIWIGHDPQCHNITGNRMANELYEAEVGENVSANVTPVRRFFRKGRELTADELPMQEAALKDIDVRNVEFDVLLPSGEWRGLLGSASPLHDADGRVRGSVGAFINITERKQAEEALRESEEKYRNLMETANEGIWILELILDAEARTTYVNQKMAEMLGCSQEAMIGKSVRDFTDEEGKAIFEMNMKRRRQGINESHEFKLLRKDGLPLWALVNSKALFDKDGKFIGSMSMLTDITKRKEAETKLKETLDNLENLVKERTAELEKAYKSLKESENSLAEAQRMAHLGHWDWDIVTDEIYWSNEVSRILGLDPQKFGVTYNTFLSYVHPEDRKYVNNAVIEALNGKPYRIDHRIISADGEERVVHSRGEVIFDEKNSPVRMKGIAQDITERKKTERALELSEERYRIITEQTGQLVYDCDIKEEATDWAGNIKELTGFASGEFGSMSLKSWLSRIHPEDRKRLLESYKKYLRSGDAYSTEYRFRKKNEEYIYFEDNGICLKDEKGNVNRILGVIKDITERKQAEETLEKIETARKKEIHHRIKNNLQVISSLLDLQAEKFRNRECVEDSEVLEAFGESQDRVMSIALIHEELHEGKGNDTLNFSPYLKRLAKNLFQTYRLGNADTRLNIDLEENIFFDMDTAVPLGIIINELVSNSLKHAFPGRNKGVIRIKLCREKSAEYTNNIQGNKKEGCKDTNFILTVSDNGIGMSESFNSESSDSLGIQLVTILVDQLGGELELKRDSGTEFVIRFTVEEKQ